MRSTRSILFLTAALALLGGCAHLRTDKTHYAGTDLMLAQGDYAAAAAQIEAAKETSYTYKDRVVYYLDVGMLYHWNGDYEKSNEALEKAERAIEENFTKSLTGSASTLILNDNAQAYAGEDYEDIYLNAFKALNYLALGKNDEAFVEVRRINNKLIQLGDKHQKTAEKLNEAEEAHEEFKPGKSPFQESALGRYLGALLYRNDYKWDDVRIDLEKLDRGWKLQPDIYSFKKPDLSTETERVSPPQARLNIIAFTGLAPDKKASGFQVYTEENVIILAGTAENYMGKQNLDGLSIIPWNGVEPGYNFKFQLPNMEKRPSQVARVDVVVRGVGTNTLQRLESLENVAVETFSIKKPMIYLKTLTRAIVKGLASQQATSNMTENMDGFAAFLTRVATTVAVGATENADLRVSRFFPAEALIRELHMEEGEYDVRVNYYQASGALLHSELFEAVSVEAGSLNVIQSAYLN